MGDKWEGEEWGDPVRAKVDPEEMDSWERLPEDEAQIWWCRTCEFEYDQISSECPSCRVEMESL